MEIKIIGSTPKKVVDYGVKTAFTRLQFIALKPPAYSQRVGTQQDTNPMPFGVATVLGSHCCVALSPVTVATLYHSMPEA